MLNIFTSHSYHRLQKKQKNININPAYGAVFAVSRNSQLAIRVVCSNEKVALIIFFFVNHMYCRCARAFHTVLYNAIPKMDCIRLAFFRVYVASRAMKIN